jgi:hypothetical protein
MSVQQGTSDLREDARMIRVDLPTAYLASDLTWHLHEPAEICELAAEHDGRQGVAVRVTGSPTQTIGHIRDWMILNGMTSLGVRVEGDEYRLTADWRGGQDSSVC